MKPLEKSAKKGTASMIVTVVLYAIGASSVPYAWLSDLLGGAKELEWIFGFIARTACAILPIYLILEFGFGDLFKLSATKLKGSLLAIPSVLIAVNNLPIIPLMSGYMSINANFWQFIPFVLNCLSIGILEEVCFRGCVFPLFAYKFSKDKKGLFWSVVCSSAVFGGVHIVNLLGGFSPFVFLQMGYSFLIGLICAFALIVSGNIYLPILMHGVYDVGGFMVSEGIASGVIWTLPNVIWTAVASVLLGAVIIIIFIKKDFSKLNGNLNLLRNPE
ncbi:MAG: CPBP family intramembrane metalloprotease [Clostridiales bacterium]|nr:CPBP family intramembrane metalloprotease [Clostridiales bacterium]